MVLVAVVVAVPLPGLLVVVVVVDHRAAELVVALRQVRPAVPLGRAPLVGPPPGAQLALGLPAVELPVAQRGAVLRGALLAAMLAAVLRVALQWVVRAPVQQPGVVLAKVQVLAQRWVHPQGSAVQQGVAPVVVRPDPATPLEQRQRSCPQQELAVRSPGR